MPKVINVLVSKSFRGMENRVSVMSKELREIKKSNTVLKKARDKYIQRFTVAHEKVLAIEITNEILTDVIRHFLVDCEDKDLGYAPSQTTINNAKRSLGVIK